MLGADNVGRAAVPDVEDVGVRHADGLADGVEDCDMRLVGGHVLGGHDDREVEPIALHTPGEESHCPRWTSPPQAGASPALRAPDVPPSKRPPRQEPHPQPLRCCRRVAGEVELFEDNLEVLRPLFAVVTKGRRRAIEPAIPAPTQPAGRAARVIEFA